MTAHWLALRSKPMKETLLCKQLSLRQIESIYPRIYKQHVNPPIRRPKPDFPGHVFGYLDLEQTNISKLQWMPGLSRIVAFGGIPAHIPDYLIAAIRRRLDETNMAGDKLSNRLKAGDIVSVQGGLFRGYDAIFDACLPGNERVRGFLKLREMRQMKLELRATQIQQKNGAD